MPGPKTALVNPIARHFCLPPIQGPHLYPASSCPSARFMWSTKNQQVGQLRLMQESHWNKNQKLCATHEGQRTHPVGPLVVAEQSRAPPRAVSAEPDQPLLIWAIEWLAPTRGITGNNARTSASPRTSLRGSQWGRLPRCTPNVDGHSRTCYHGRGIREKTRSIRHDVSRGSRRPRVALVIAQGSIGRCRTRPCRPFRLYT